MKAHSFADRAVQTTGDDVMKKSVIFGSVMTAFGLAIAGTFLLPETVTLERRAIVKLAPEAVLALAGSGAGYQQFNPYKNTDPSLKITTFGPHAGIGSGFKFDGKEGKGSQTIVAISPSKVSYLIDLGPMGRPTQAIAVAPHSQGSEVTWSMSMELGANPAMRVMGLVMDGMMGPILETGLANLNIVS
jgi:Polyketide cyclase / dehydrase and lipid transport